MKTSGWVKLALTVFLAAALVGCGRGKPEIDVKEVLSKPKAFVGSDQCKLCHLEHYDSWKTTLHSRTIQDVAENRDAVIANIDPEVIRRDLKKQEKNLKVPLEEIYIPKLEEIKYTIGIQWKQQYLVEKNGTLYIAPLQYNTWDDTWVSYHEDDWDQRPWAEKCGGCHVMGLDLEKNTFAEARVGCEACHGPGSHHAALPKTALFDKRLTIVNPSKLSTGIRTQICGSCHSRGESTKVKGVAWPVEHVAGQALGPYYKLSSYADGDGTFMYPNELAKGHHMQFMDWQKSLHAREGVTCTSCHYVHQLGVAPTQFQTKGSGSQQCLICHQVINPNMAHSIHSFANCIGCHMPRIAQSAVSGDLHSHAFIALLPKVTLANPENPNSCVVCHKHKDADLATLQQTFDGLSKRTLLGVHRTYR